MFETPPPKGQVITKGKGKGGADFTGTALLISTL